jgi:bacterioferritin-associated ferredoxin
VISQPCKAGLGLLLKTEFNILTQGAWMYVCVCRAVTENEVRAAIDAGADTVAAVTGACCAGDDCGACHGVIRDLIEERAERGHDSLRRLPLVPVRAA